MSGFEVVGVLLGSIPLMISALGHYSAGVSTMRSVRYYEDVFLDLQIRIAVSVSTYRGSCEKLLSPLNLPDKTMFELCEGRAWDDADLGEKLSDRLGKDCFLYRSLVKQLNKKLTLFAKKLKMGEDMRPSWVKEDDTVDEKLRQKFFNNFWNRVKGGLARERFTKLLDEIDGDCERIAALTNNVVDLEPIRIERKRQLNGPYWIGVRDQAKRLFNILSSRWSSTCPCRHSHRANLRLDMRRGHDITQNNIRFALTFSFDEDVTAATSMPWDWRDVEIETLDIPATNISVHHSNKKNVSYAAAPSIALSPSYLVRSTSSPNASPAATKIDDLCNALRRRNPGNCCLGFLDDQPWQHHIYSVTSPASQNQARKTASLDEILSKGIKSNLAIREKCTLALTLALAVLQLHDTPWLEKSWNMKDIRFVYNSDEISLVDRAYVSRTFTALPCSQHSAQRKIAPFIKNEMVFALGIALLELSWGKSIWSFKIDTDCLDGQGHDTLFTKCCIATRLADIIHERELPNYAQAVLRCIRFKFDTFTCSLDDSDFRECFYQGVIIPLQQDYDYVMGPSGHH